MRVQGWEGRGSAIRTGYRSPWCAGRTCLSPGSSLQRIKGGNQRWIEAASGRGSNSVTSRSRSSIHTSPTPRKVEDYYGDLDKLYAENRLDEALQAEIPNVADKNRSSYRTAVNGTASTERRRSWIPSHGPSDSSATCRPRSASALNNLIQISTSLMVALSVPCFRLHRYHCEGSRRHGRRNRTQGRKGPPRGHRPDSQLHGRRRRRETRPPGSRDSRGWRLRRQSSCCGQSRTHSLIASLQRHVQVLAPRRHRTVIDEATNGEHPPRSRSARGRRSPLVGPLTDCLGARVHLRRRPPPCAAGVRRRVAAGDDDVLSIVPSTQPRRCSVPCPRLP